MRFLIAAAALCLISCAEEPGPAPPPKDPTTDPAYTKSVSELVSMNRDAERLLREHKPDAASDLITKGEPIASRILGVPHPTLEAAEAASDVDELYGRMLLTNRNYGWARMQFQKNLARWKHWQPQTPDTESRVKKALAEIDQCDREMMK